MSEVAKNLAYKDFIAAIKSQVQSAQIKAAVSVNRELLQLYWLMGSQIVEKQETARWGDGLVKQMSRDLQEEFPDMKGFSIRNIKYMKQWFKFWHDSNLIGQQLVAQNKNPITTQVVAIRASSHLSNPLGAKPAHYQQSQHPRRSYLLCPKNHRK